MIKACSDILGPGQGECRLVDYMGNDTRVVNMARVSFDRWVDEMEHRDYNLIDYLANHKHEAPFRHIYFTWYFEAPLFVAMQIYKHCVGAEFAFKDMPWSQRSGRYVTQDKHYYPKIWRKQARLAKQGSDGEVDPIDLPMLEKAYERALEAIEDFHSIADDVGLARELKRLVDPQATFTAWFWTASLQATCHMIRLRDDDHAQWETRQYAKAMVELIPPEIIYSFKALRK